MKRTLMPRPPRFARWLLEMSLPPGARKDAILGDLQEEFQDDVRHHPVGARLRYSIDAIGIASRYVWIGGNRSEREREGNIRNTLRGLSRWDDLRQDMRFSVRMLLKNRTFTSIAVLTLAVGIGISTTVFSALFAVLLRPLPFRDAERMVMVWQEYANRDWGLVEISYPNFLDLQDQSNSFDHLAAFAYEDLTVSRGDLPERITGLRISSGLFPALGIEPFLGRNFVPEEERPGAPRAVLVSHRLWENRFGSDPALPGSAITLNGEPYTVTGVMPQGFQFPPPFETTVAGVATSVPSIEFWVPLAADQFPIRREMRNFMALGVLTEGVSLEQAQVEATGIAARLARSYPEPNADLGIRLVPLHEQVVGSTRVALLVLFGAVGFVTLIACANVANLLLARAAGRQKEMAIRLALGAGRTRLLHQLIVESLCLALLGGVAGLLLARGAVSLFVAFGPADFPRLDEVGIYSEVLAFNLALSLITGLIFGVAPAWSATKSDPGRALKEESGGGRVGPGRARATRTLVAGELALCIVLLAGAGLMLRSLIRLVDVDPGFDAEKLLALQLFVPPEVARGEEPRVDMHLQLIDQLESLSGVEAAGTVSVAPLSTEEDASLGVVPENALPGTQPLQVSERPVSATYFRTMGIPLLEGRSFDERDRLDAPRVAVINEAMARRLWPGGEGVGRRLRHDGEESWTEVVGVAGNVRQFGLDLEPMPEMYLPYLQNPGRGVTVMVRATGDPMSIAGIVRAEIGRVHPELPVSQIRTMTSAVSTSLAEPRWNTILLALFAFVALVLAAVGVYGLVTSMVQQRTQEVGVRLALGADPSDILGTLLKREVGTVLMGIAVGLVAAALLTRLAVRLFYEVTPTDPMTLAAVSILLAVVALLAALVPLRRALRLDPVIALRNE